MNRLLMAAAVAALAVGCGGGGDDGGDGTDDLNGFATPDDITRAYMGADGNWTEIGPANWSCLNTPSGDQPTSVEVTLSGAIQDFQTSEPLADATVTLYDSTDFSGQGIASATSDVDGNVSLTVPTGSERLAVKVVADKALDTYTLNQIYEPDVADQSDEFNSVSVSTANALPAFIGVTRTPGLGVVAGSVRDCDGHEVGGAIATVSSVSGSPEHLTGAQTYYFSATQTSLPTRHQLQPSTNSDSLFVVIELPPTQQAFLQVWGFIDGQDPGSDDLTLLAEIPAPVLGDSVITASLEPLRQ